MANFPRQEAEIKALAQSIITGLDGNADFPSPPFAPAELQSLLNSFISLGDAQIAAQAAAQQATEAKQAALAELTAAMKSPMKSLFSSNSSLFASCGLALHSRYCCSCFRLVV